MKKIIIGLISRPIHSSTNRLMLGVYESYIRTIIRCGAIPIIISPTSDINYEIKNINIELKKTEIENLEYVLGLCDGIIMPGGDKAFKYDYEVLKWAIKKDIPILGICLGMQIMCTLEKNKLKLVKNHYNKTHKVYLIESKLKKIFNKNILYVNSRHKEQVINSGLYKISAISSDGIIEAVELDKNTFNIGVQWHPEDLLDQKELFTYFINTIKKQK